MTYQPNDPEFYQFLLDDMPAAAMHKWAAPCLGVKVKNPRPDRRKPMEKKPEPA